MAKKGQQVLLQAEINTDDEWEKLLQKPGLIVVDIYSEWCGPCSGMAGILKKIKLEIGGDTLVLAVAKSDKIAALERFRGKSEPTWMFISGGKMVNFMYGASAPLLTKVITEELKKENDARAGQRDRSGIEISEMAGPERERYEVVATRKRIEREKEEAKAAKELRARRTAECEKILETYADKGVILVFPHAKEKYSSVLQDYLPEAACVIQQTEKVTVTTADLEELFYFVENPFTEADMDALTSDVSIILLLKPGRGADHKDPMEKIMARIIYGKDGRPPGSLTCPNKVLGLVPSEENPEEIIEITAFWTPETDFIKAVALKLFFPKLTKSHVIPEPEPTPEHYTVIYEAYRRRDIAKLMDQYSEHIMHYGFFTSEDPEEAELIARTMLQFEQNESRKATAQNRKLVIQLSRKKSECVLAFAQTKPYYMSANTSEGKKECKLFFPDEYDEEQEDEDEEGLNTSFYLPQFDEVEKVPVTSGKQKKAKEDEVEDETSIVETAAEAEGEKVEGAEEPTEGVPPPEGVLPSEGGPPLEGVPPLEGGPPLEGAPLPEAAPPPPPPAEMSPETVPAPSPAPEATPEAEAPAEAPSEPPPPEPEAPPAE